MNLKQLKQDLTDIYCQSNVRGLRQSTKWASEMLFSLKTQTEVRSKCLGTDPNNTFENVEQRNLHFGFHLEADYMMAKSVFDLGEYTRAAHITANSVEPETRFLHYYSKYLSIEKERLDKMINPTSVLTTIATREFIDLGRILELLVAKEESADKDAYIHYLRGIILLKLGNNSEAKDVLIKSLMMNPLCWSSWHQLTQIIEDESQILKIGVPNHWLKNFFKAAAFLEIQSNEASLAIYEDLLETFTDNNYLRTQIAIAKYNMRDVDGAVDLFSAIRSVDPYRMDAMDIYSNLLYVKEMQSELSSLAHLANQIDPFRVESCFCIANFYSLRGQHAKAVLYFARALQLNPKHLSAWTLMGHEYIELKNTRAAIQAYRSAIKCNPRDYRAWYGLGQAYEILKMPQYCLYYYSKAYFLKPTDSRLIVAIGETYEKMNRYEDAANCYSKAGFSSLLKLGNIYERMKQEHKAALVYNEFVNQFDSKKDLHNLSVTELSTCYKYLAFYFYRQKRFEDAKVAARICMFFKEGRDEIKDLLHKLENSLVL